MADVNKRTAKELSPELDRLINDVIEIGDSDQIDALTTFMFENKMGILRVLQSVAAD